MLNFKSRTFPIFFFFAVTYIHVAPVQWELKLKFYIEQKLIKNTLYNNTIIVLYLIFHEGFFFWYFGFPLSWKTYISKFQFVQLNLVIENNNLDCIHQKQYQLFKGCHFK